MTWHGKGDYFASVVSDNSNMQVLIHQTSKRWSQNPFRKSKGLVQCVLFHPIRPYFFVATQRYVRIYNLLKQELTKKLMTNCKWVSSMAIHPGGTWPAVLPKELPGLVSRYGASRSAGLPGVQAGLWVLAGHPGVRWRPQ